MAVKRTAADDAATDAAASAVEPVASAGVAFADGAYTSRSLFLQAGDDLREFKVQAGRVTVPADDAEALAFLGGHADLQRLDG
ncbi:hypothetical protein DV532_18800 [Pseudomonas sp. Leaf58]|uniref:hypothetical protein n=1 Tax=Pseudomonas sp. Leaf58 TaxID=1736226 RepID=UPI0006F5BE4A|nr:hypothetical protein [Pseudomonas sp. Leaf58]AYG46225.1 hypothetical protein DV532_18800 [Pseudomonas sp. Leaf58]KQN59485.1 hypothetical protein ASF02_21800 [Pseudomonas sp. Leaf58]